MGSATVRRGAAVGLLLVLVLGGAVLPAAVADDATPTPSASPTARPSPSATPSPSAGEPTPPTPEPTPSPSATQTGPLPQPRQVPAPRRTTPPAPTDATRGHRAGGVTAAASVVIGELDCDALTTQVTIDSAGATHGTAYVVSVLRRANGATEQISDELVFLEPGARTTVTVALAADALNTVRVSAPDLPWVEKQGVCGAYVLDPRASIDSTTCGTLEAVVTLDNTRSTDVVRFFLNRSSRGADGRPSSFSDAVSVDGGTVATRTIPLAQDSTSSVQVSSDAPGGTVLASADAVCGEIALASVAALDCGALSTVVTLDNSRMPVSTTFTIDSGERYQKVERTIDVPAGDTVEVPVTLVDDAVNDVVVTLANGAHIASVSGECGTWVDDPRASVGTVDCGTLDVAVTLDNSRSSARTAFVVQRTTLGDDHADPVTSYVLTAGEVRVVHVVTKDATVTTVTVTVGAEEGRELASVRGPLCGLLTVGPVDCGTSAFTVTLVNDDADHSYSRRFRVSSSRYPKDRTAFAQEVQVAPSERRVLTIPVEALHGGDLRVVELGTISGAVLHEEPVEVRCPAGSGGGGSGAPATSGAGRLAATGADGILLLVGAGLVLVLLGAGLVGAGRVRTGRFS